MFLLFFTLFITSVLGCNPEEPTIDFSQPVSPFIYHGVIKQGFATNYFKTRLPPAYKYRTKNIQDIYDMGFSNLRLRCRPELYNDMYNTTLFDNFLTKLTEVVDECLCVGVAPIISWEHHQAEAYATEQDQLNYIDWWTRVANQLKDRDYRLSFNLFTELGVDVCKDNCAGSLRRNKTKYHEWTARVVSAIRATGGNNTKRILILGSPEKTSIGLQYINTSNSYMDSYMMVEWHEYAAGPSFESHRPRYWSGNGSEAQKSRLREGIERANNFTRMTNIPTYFGAWMPRDNEKGGLVQSEVVSFAKFFVSLLKEANIPWSLNVIDNYYRTRFSKWITSYQTLAGARLNMSQVLDTILEEM